MAFQEADILTIPIRSGLAIHVHGIPHDLTEAEAEKIANIILAHVEPGRKALEQSR